LENPAMFSPEDIEEGVPGESLGGLEDIESTYPEEMLGDSIEESDISSEALEGDELEDEDEITTASTEPIEESEMIRGLRRLKAGEPLDDMSDGDVQDVASDIAAPTELRKRALEKIKQKY